MNLSSYVLNQKSIPLTGLAVGGFNGGWPYQVQNQLELGTFGKTNKDFLEEENGYLPPTFNAIGSAGFGPRPRAFTTSWQNSGAGWGMPVLNPSPYESNAQSVPKELRPTKEDMNNVVSPDGILKGIELENNVNFSRGGQTIRGKKNSEGVYTMGAPAGWVESKSNRLPYRGSSLPI